MPYTEKQLQYMASGLPLLPVGNGIYVPYDTRPRTYEATVYPDQCMHVNNADSEFSGMSDEVFFINANDIHLANRQYRGCNKSKFYNQYLRRKRR